MSIIKYDLMTYPFDGVAVWLVDYPWFYDVLSDLIWWKPTLESLLDVVNHWLYQSNATTVWAEVFYQTFWMRAYKHPTAKRTIVFSNSALVKYLDRGSLKRSQLKGEHSTTDQYMNREGAKKFKGNKKLKGTQFLGWNWIWDFREYHPPAVSHFPPWFPRPSNDALMISLHNSLSFICKWQCNANHIQCCSYRSLRLYKNVN